MTAVQKKPENEARLERLIAKGYGARRRVNDFLPKTEIFKEIARNRFKH